MQTRLAYPYFAFLPNLKGIISTTSAPSMEPAITPTMSPGMDGASGRSVHGEEASTSTGMNWTHPVSLRVQGGCFESTAFRYHAGTRQVEIDAGRPSSPGCSDFYMLATTSSFHLEHVTRRGRYLVEWPLPADQSDAERWDEAAKGIRVFLFATTVEETWQSVFQTAALFEPVLTQDVSERAAARNAKFLKDYAGFVFEKLESNGPAEEEEVSVQVERRRMLEDDEGTHKVPLRLRTREAEALTSPLLAIPLRESGQGRAAVIEESEVGNGDLFGVLRMDGLDPMLAWGMGATTGHMTTALWMATGEGDAEEEALYIVESQVKSSYWPQNNVQRTPFRQWMQWADAAGYNVLYVPLSDEARAAFDVEKARAWFREMEGLAYGYHSLLWGWVDTERENYPCLPPGFDRCLEWAFLEVAFALIDRHVPAIATLLWSEAFNKRVGTEGLTTSEVWMRANLSLSLPSSAVPGIVEEDVWLYQTSRERREGGREEVLGRAMVCCVFVCGIWKAAGLFGEASEEINCGELTNADDVMLALFRGDMRQILGKWKMFLPSFNFKKPFPHMDEKCPSLGPAYQQPLDC